MNSKILEFDGRGRSKQSRRILTVVASVLLLAVVMTSLAFLFRTGSSSVEAFEVDLTQRTQNSLTRLALWQEQYERVLTAFVNDPDILDKLPEIDREIASEQREAFVTTLGRRLGVIEHRGFYLLSMSGNTILSSNGYVNEDIHRGLVRSGFSGEVWRNRFGVSVPYALDPAAKKDYAVDMAVPIRKNGLPYGILGVRVGVEQYLSFPMRAGMKAPHDIVILFDGRANEVARVTLEGGLSFTGNLLETDASAVAGDNRDTNVIIAERAIRSNSHEYYSSYSASSGRNFIGHWKWSPELNVGMAILTDEDEVFKETRSFRLVILISSLFSCCLILVGVYLLRSEYGRLLSRQSDLQEIFEKGHSGIFILDTGGQILNLNQFGSELLCSTVENLIGSRFRDFVHPSDRDVWRQAIEDALLKQFVGELKCILPTEDGRTELSVEVTLTHAVMDAHDVLLLHVIDVSGRKTAESESTQRAAKYRILFDNIPDCVLIYDAEGTILDANGAALRSLRYTRGEVVSMNMSHVDEAFKPQNRGQVWRGLDRPRAESGHMMRKDGSTFPVNKHLVSYEEKGEVFSILAARDTSDLLQAQDEARSIREQFRYRFQRYQDLQTSMAREIRTLWQDTTRVVWPMLADDHQAERDVPSIRNNLEWWQWRWRDTVDVISQIVAADSGYFEKFETTSSLFHLRQDLVREFEVGMSRLGITLVVQSKDDTQELIIERDRLRQIVGLNLFELSQEMGTKVVSVSLTTEQVGARVWLSVDILSDLPPNEATKKQKALPENGDPNASEALASGVLASGVLERPQTEQGTREKTASGHAESSFSWIAASMLVASLGGDLAKTVTTEGLSARHVRLPIAFRMGI